MGWSLHGRHGLKGFVFLNTGAIKACQVDVRCDPVVREKLREG